MGKYFSRLRGPQVTQDDRAVLKLKEQKRRLEGERTRCESVIERYDEAIKTLLVQGRKKDALFTLKMRKMHEKQLDTLMNFIMKMEGLLLDVQGAQTTQNVTNAMKEGARVMKSIMAEVKVEDVERIMEDTHEAREWMREVADRMNIQVDAAQEEQVEKELAEMERSMAVKAEDLPSVPTTALPKQANRDREEAQERARDAEAEAELVPA